VGWGGGGEGVGAGIGAHKGHLFVGTTPVRPFDSWIFLLKTVSTQFYER